MSKTEHLRFSLLVFVCVGISIGSIVLSAMTCTPGDAGLGGSIGVALSFAALFLSRNYGNKVYKLITETLPEIELKLDPPDGKQQALSGTETGSQAEALKALANEVAGVKAQLDVERQGHFGQNLYLATASVLSTLFWGFGEWGVSHFVACAKEPTSMVAPLAHGMTLMLYTVISMA